MTHAHEDRMTTMPSSSPLQRQEEADVLLLGEGRAWLVAARGLDVSLGVGLVVVDRCV